MTKHRGRLDRCIVGDNCFALCDQRLQILWFVGKCNECGAGLFHTQIDYIQRCGDRAGCRQSATHFEKSAAQLIGALLVDPIVVIFLDDGSSLGIAQQPFKLHAHWFRIVGKGGTRFGNQPFTLG